MAITTSQLNTGKALVLDRLFARYPGCRLPALRIVLQERKDAIAAGQATRVEIANAILNQAYQFAKSVDPNLNATTKHAMKHWQHEALGDDPDDPTTGVSTSDAAEAQAVTVI